MSDEESRTVISKLRAYFNSAGIPAVERWRASWALASASPLAAAVIHACQIWIGLGRSCHSMNRVAEMLTERWMVEPSLA